MTDQTNIAEQIEAAKAALTRKDFPEARRILTPMAEEKPTGTATFFLARLEMEEGNYDAMPPLLDSFQAPRPNHAGVRLLRARMHQAKGEMDAARAEAEAALDINPDLPAAQRILDQGEAQDAAQKAQRHVSVLDKGYLDARNSGVTEAMRRAAQALSQMVPGPNWADDTLQAKIAYFHFATDLEQALLNYDPHLIDVSTRFDYITWPKRIQEHVQGKSVIDVGCAFGGYGMGFLVAGATSYAGLDPLMKLDSTRAKNKRVRKWDDMGVTPREIEDTLPAIRLFECIAEEMPVKETFDTIALHNVTEHLIQLDLVFEGLVPLCHAGSHIIYLHHNFYCWNGHHFAPNQPHQINLDEPRQRQVYDWQHIDIAPDVPEDHYFKTKLNRVRLDEIKAITEKHFDVVTWKEIPSSKATLARLTPEIFERVQKTVPDITRRELETNVVFCIAKPKFAAG